MLQDGSVWLHRTVALTIGEAARDWQLWTPNGFDLGETPPSSSTEFSAGLLFGLTNPLSPITMIPEFKCDPKDWIGFRYTRTHPSCQIDARPATVEIQTQMREFERRVEWDMVDHWKKGLWTPYRLELVETDEDIASSVYGTLRAKSSCRLPCKRGLPWTPNGDPVENFVLRKIRRTLKAPGGSVDYTLSCSWTEITQPVKGPCTLNWSEGG